MKWTLPRPSRACCCLPLRRGIIAFVYLNLVLSLGLHVAFVFSDYVKMIGKVFELNYQEYVTLSGRSKVNDLTVFSCLFGGVLGEICMSVVALIGLHKERIKLVRAYLFFTVVYTVLVLTIRTLNYHAIFFMWEVEVPAVLLFIVIKIYYILLLRSQCKEMEENNKPNESEVELRNINGSANNSVSGDEIDHSYTDKYDIFNDSKILIVHDFEENK